MNRWNVTLVSFTILCLCGISEPAMAQTYAYDAAGRLIGVAYPNGNGIRYAYDAADNMLSATAISLPRAPTGLTVVRTSPTTARLSWQASPNAVRYVIMRRLRNGNAWVEIATVSGTTSFNDTSLEAGQDYVYRLAAEGANGRSANSKILAPSSSSSINAEIPAGGSGTVSSLATFPAVRSGYATVSVELGNTPYGTAVFGFSQNGVVVSEAGVPASPLTRKARIFIDYRTGVTSASGQFAGTIDTNTGVAMVNSGARDANLTFTLKTPDARPIASGAGTLVAGAHVAKFINELVSIAPGFDVPADFPTAIQFGSLEIAADQPISVMALRMTTNQRGELLFTSTPVADLTVAVSSAPVYFPHFVDGGGYATAVILMNTSTAIQSGTVELLRDDGGALEVRSAAGSAGASFPFSIEPGGIFVFESDGSTTPLTTGWLRVVPSPNSTAPVGAGLFRLSTGGIVVTESGIPSVLPTTRARIFVDKSGGHDTGLAVASLRNSPATITVRSFQGNGTTPAAGSPASLNLSANGHRANLAGELFPNLQPGFTGVLELSSDTPFLALTLRLLTNARGEALLTTFPIADLTRPAPAPVVFPQIADGGGFKTEIILLSPHGPVDAAIRFFDDNGVPLAVGNVQ